jgi:predicted small secreted protein
MKKTFLLMAMCILLTGCGLMGPTPKDVMKAADAVKDALMDSAQYNPQINSEYSNAADLVAVAPDGSVANRAKVYIDSAHALLINGECTFTNYKEKNSGYILNGTVTYKFDDIRKDDPQAMTMHATYDITLTGGKVTSLKVTVDKEKGTDLATEIFANGKKFDIEEWKDAMGLLKAIAPGAAN